MLGVRATHVLNAKRWQVCGEVLWDRRCEMRLVDRATLPPEPPPPTQVVVSKSAPKPEALHLPKALHLNLKH